MRQEIRKQFRGEPRLWDAEVAIDDVGAYLIEPLGRLIPLTTGKMVRLSLFSTPGEFAHTVQRNRKQYAQARAEPPMAVIDPNLVLYSPTDDAFYRFDRFTAKYAVFRFLRRNG